MTGKRKRNDPTPVNLDIPAGASSEGAHAPASLSESESSWYDKLVLRLSSCGAMCPHGSDAFCAKTKDNAHVRFLTNHLTSWAKVLVRCNISFFLSLE
jgi:hypothetical protein